MIKYASRALEYNNVQIVKKHAWPYDSNHFNKKYDVSVLLGPSPGEHIYVDVLYIYIMFIHVCTLCVDIFDTVIDGTEEATAFYKDVWDLNILQMLIIIIRQDFSILPGTWKTSAQFAVMIRLAAMLPSML